MPCPLSVVAIIRLHSDADSGGMLSDVKLSISIVCGIIKSMTAGLKALTHVAENVRNCHPPLR